MDPVVRRPLDRSSLGSFCGHDWAPLRASWVVHVPILTRQIEPGMRSIAPAGTGVLSSEHFPGLLKTARDPATGKRPLVLATQGLALHLKPGIRGEAENSPRMGHACSPDT